MYHVCPHPQPQASPPLSRLPAPHFINTLLSSASNSIWVSPKVLRFWTVPLFPFSPHPCPTIFICNLKKSCIFYTLNDGDDELGLFPLSSWVSFGFSYWRDVGSEWELYLQGKKREKIKRERESEKGGQHAEDSFHHNNRYEGDFV